MLLAALAARSAGAACAPREVMTQRPPVTAMQARQIEREIVAEMNFARTDPAGYARMLEGLLPRFDGRILRRTDGSLLETEEGPPAVREAIAALRRQRPVGPLTLSPGMSLAARDHVRDQGPDGRTGHDGRDGSSAAERVSRYGKWDVVLRENIAYGPRSARDVVAGLIIDDGVRDRGHRVNMFDGASTVAGVACGPHAKYGAMCVIVYAGRFREGAARRAYSEPRRVPRGLAVAEKR